MADRNAARKERPRDTSDGDTPVAPAVRARKSAAKTSPVELDRVIHERVRLAIVSALAGARSLSFNDLKTKLDITDGNLSVHARRLEDAGFITCEKTFVDRMPRTEYQITPAGRKALDEYLDHMESLIRRVREG
jgi:DNA-binding HxlR family transcriptional regulator